MVHKEEILDFLREQKGKLFIDYQLVKIGLFGSFARNEAHIGSDIDIIVEFEPNTENLAEKKMLIKNMITERFQREVDLCREKYIKPYFKTQILQSVIYV